MKIETATIVRLKDALLKSGRRGADVVSPAYETLAREGLLSEAEKQAIASVGPLAETMFLMMAADERHQESERDALRGAIRGLTDNLLHDGTINVMLEGFERALEREGRDERLEAVARTLEGQPEQAEGAFALAAAVALADEEVADSERALISQLADWFGIGELRITQILDQLHEDKSAQ